jgi:hypothetical protein
MEGESPTRQFVGLNGAFRRNLSNFIRVLWPRNEPKDDATSLDDQDVSPSAAQHLRQTPPTLPPGLREEEEEPHTSGKFAFSDLQHILYIEGKAQEASVMLQLNLGVLEEIRQHYIYIIEQDDCPKEIKENCNITRFVKSIRGIEKEMRLQHSRFETFKHRLADHRDLVSKHERHLLPYLSLMISLAE